MYHLRELNQQFTTTSTMWYGWSSKRPLRVVIIRIIITTKSSNAFTPKLGRERIHTKASTGMEWEVSAEGGGGGTRRASSWCVCVDWFAEAIRGAWASQSVSQPASQPASVRISLTRSRESKDRQAWCNPSKGCRCWSSSPRSRSLALRKRPIRGASSRTLARLMRIWDFRVSFFIFFFFFCISGFLALLPLQLGPLPLQYFLEFLGERSLFSSLGCGNFLQ